MLRRETRGSFRPAPLIKSLHVSARSYSTTLGQVIFQVFITAREHPLRELGEQTTI